MSALLPAPPTPHLSVGLVSYAAEAPPDWNTLLETVRMYDRAGIDRISISDHVVMGEHIDAYGNPATGGTTGGKQPTGPDGHWLEPLTTLSVIAGMTSRVRLGTGILLAALRRPVVLAKSAATLDTLSGGRLDLGVGVGWQREEYEAAGLDFGHRGRLLDHALEVCTELWTQQAADYSSEELSFTKIHMMPKPLQPGGVPIWVSGRIGPRVVDRICRFGLRWIPWGDDAMELGRSIPEMRTRIEAAGLSSDGLQVVGNLRVVPTDDGAIDIDASLAGVPALVEAGATDILVRLPARAPDAETEADVHAFVSAFRAATGREPVA